MVLSQNILFSKEFLECISHISNYLPKLNIGLEIVSGAHFLYIFLK